MQISTGFSKFYRKVLGHNHGYFSRQSSVEKKINCFTFYFFRIFRTSKQTWLHDRIYNLPPELNPSGDSYLYKDGHIMAENMKEIPKLPANVYDYLQIADATAFKFSKRIQLATQMNVMGLFASESYQIANYGIGILAQKFQYYFKILLIWEISLIYLFFSPTML